MKKLLSIILTAVMLCSIFALPAAAETVTDNRVWFDLNGNSNLFMVYSTKTDSEYYNKPTATGYIPGVDYTGHLSVSGATTKPETYSSVLPTGDFTTDRDALFNAEVKGCKIGCFRHYINYTSTTTLPNFKTEDNENYFWTVTDTAGVEHTYKVNPYDKIIKLFANVNTTNIENNENLDSAEKSKLVEAFNSLKNGVTINVEDGNYNKIGLFTGIQTSTREKAVKVTYKYKDNTSQTESKPIKINDNTWGYYPVSDMSKNNHTALNHIYYTELEFTPDSKKVLTEIIVSDDAETENYGGVLYVMSAYGIKRGYTAALAELDELNKAGITDVASYEALKAKLDEVIALLELESKTVDNLTDSERAIYDAADTSIKKYEDDANRIEKLNARTYNYLPLSADRDVFVTWKDVTDLARFNYDAAGKTTVVPDGFNTATYDYNGTTIFEWIPHERADGTPVTGKEYYYYKGFKNVSLTELSENEAERGAAPASATFAYLLDDITAEDGAIVTGKKVAGISSSSKYGSDEYFAGSDGVARATTDTTKTVTNPAFVQTLDEDGYFIIKKNAGSETHYKIGPVAQNGYSPNAQIIGSSINNVNVKGTTLDLLITATNINYSTTYYKTASAAINFAPAAALQQVTVTYEDGETETKYAVVTDNKIASYNGMYTENPVLKTIVFAPKYEEDGITEIEYDENSFYANKADYDFKILKGNTATVGLTDSVSADDVSFKNPHIIMSSNTRVAQMLQIRQDTVGNNYGAFSSSVSLPLANKKVESIAFPVTQNIAIDDPSAIVVLDNAKDASKSTVALLPVKIKGANDKDYVYFAYLGRISSETCIMAATVTDNSGNEKIQAAQDAMSKITANSTIEEAKKAKELYNIALENANVKTSDFDSDIVEEFERVYEELRQNANLSGRLEVIYYQGSAPTVKVEINNPAEYADKPYRVILAYYDENGNYISSKVHTDKSTTAEKLSFTITDEEYPKNVAKVKGFIWKDFATLIPLANAADSEIRTTLKVLSIGNSYSDDAHTYLTEIAQSAGFEEIIIGNAYRGGCTLNQHHSYITSNTPAYIYKLKKLNENGSISKTNSGTEANTTLLECITAEDWDIITIQQGSAESGKDNTYGNLQNIINYVNANKTNKNAKIVWHQTWAYADNSNVLDERYNGISQLEMYNRIVSAMQTNVLPLDDIAFVIPAGTAVQNARAKLGDVLTESDAVHLNSMGDYVAGLTWFTKITGMSIDNITYAPAAVGDNLETIKTAVKNAITNPYQVTE